MLYSCDSCEKKFTITPTEKYYCSCPEKYGSLALIENKVYLFFLDFETTGLCTKEDDIIQASFRIVEHQTNRTVLNVTSFIHTTKQLIPKITELTGITKDMLIHAPTFQTFWEQQIVPVLKQLTECGDDTVHIVFVAHNGFGFDFLFLKRYIDSHKLFIPEQSYYWLWDSLFISRKLKGVFLSHKLGEIYKTLFGHYLEGLHRADNDVQAMYDIYQHDLLKPYHLRGVKPFTIKYEKVDIEHVPVIQNCVFSKQQLDIIHCDMDYNQCILAGAGCAKTTTIIGRLIYLLNNGVPPEKIMFCTFTRDASESMINRLNVWTQQTIPIISGTIDSISRRLLKEYDYELFSSCVHVGDYKHALLYLLSRVYCPKKIALTDSIKYIFFDEFQDINETYYKIIKAFYMRGTRIVAVGDDSQNIYEWNNTNTDYIINFEKHFDNSKLFYLNTNYRSTPEIIDLANASISNNVNKYPKDMFPMRPSQSIYPEVYSFHSWKNEADFVIYKIQELVTKKKIPLHEIVVMSRTNTDKGQLYYMEEQFAKNLISTQMLEGNEYSRKSLKPNHVCFSTIHKTKGLEWDVVFVVGCNDTFFPGNKRGKALEEERRLFYVAITRAKTYLYMTFTFSQTNRYVTRFISEVHPHFYHTNDYDFSRFFVSNINAEQKNNGVRQLVSINKLVTLLKDEHVQYIKNMPNNQFPRLEWDSRLVHRSFVYPKWVQDMNLYYDFGIWIDNLITRQINERKKSLQNRQCLRILNYLLLEGSEYDIYSRYKYHIKIYLRKIVRDEIEINRQNLKAICQLPHHERVIKLSHVPEKDCDKVVSLMLKIYEHSLSSGCEPTEVYVSNVCVLDDDEYDMIYESYIKYTNSSLSYEEILWDTFVVSWTSMIERGRKRLLHYEWDKPSILADTTEMFSVIKNNVIDQLFPSSGICKMNLCTDIPCEIDFYIPETKTLVDYKLFSSGGCGGDIHSPNIQHILQLLMYVCSLFEKGYEVENIMLYNPLSGIVMETKLPKGWSYTEFYNKMLWFASLFNQDSDISSVKPLSNSIEINVTEQKPIEIKDISINDIDIDYIYNNIKCEIEQIKKTSGELEIKIEW